MEEEERVRILSDTTYLLLRLGFQAQQIGYRYLREAVLVVCQDPETITSVTKLLYPEVAKRFDTTDKQVERAIRNSIETAWQKGKCEMWQEYFEDFFTQHKTRPTNTEVVKALVRYISKER